MDPDHWRHINDIFQATLARATDARQPFLAEVCGGDAGLREDVERLVRAHERATGFLARPALVQAPNVLSLVDLSAPVAHQHATDPFETGFRGTERFTVLRRLGAGGMGVVYAVHDSVRNEAVALKTLRRARPADVSRLKREFRSLADIAHPNIVCLYELVVEPDHCFFTMELVDGLGVSDYIRPPVAATGMPGAEGQHADAGLVRSVLRQLVAGVSALHDSGKLHRDIKPSNIMVSPDGRVVILDVGLMTDMRPSPAAADDRMAGTPAYLAPEQHARRRRLRGERLVRRRLSALAAGALALLAGEWKKASLECARALVVLRDQCTGATWEINNAESFQSRQPAVSW